MGTRMYDQFCPVAQALDVVGERWTLLIVRDLLSGPKRFTDLRRGLPGIPSNLLAGRLVQLEEAGLIARRQLPPPAARTVYELTPEGRDLEPVVRSLARWGMHRLPPPTGDDVEPDTAVRAGLLAYARPGAATAPARVWLARLGGEDFTVELASGRISYHRGTPPEPDLVVSVDPAGLIRFRQADPGTGIRPTLDYRSGDAALIGEFEAVFALA